MNQPILCHALHTKLQLNLQTLAPQDDLRTLAPQDNTTNDFFYRTNDFIIKRRKGRTHCHSRRDISLLKETEYH